MTRAPELLMEARVYEALQRRPTMAGLPQDAFLLMALIMVSLAIASRLDPLVLVSCGVVYLALLPVLRRLFTQEPYLTEIIPRAMRYASRYPRQAKETSTCWRDRVASNPRD
ncbi:MAG: VirB3 family type IV secretion system protein [Bacteroidota bacterium]|nr:VirB3 family type IV secretion system protein [Bacteroidota bacterium]